MSRFVVNHDLNVCDSHVGSSLNIIADNSLFYCNTINCHGAICLMDFILSNAIRKVFIDQVIIICSDHSCYLPVLKSLCN